MPQISDFDPSMRLLRKVLDLRSQNQEVIASNIANAETPGYSARNFSFEEELRGALGSGGLRTGPPRPGHIPLAPTGIEEVSGTLDVRKDTTGIGDENSVSVDQEMVKLSKNELLYETAITMINKKLSMLKYAINGGA